MDRTRITRETSREAYKELVESGGLEGWLKAVWGWLYKNGPATRNEVAVGVNGVPNDISTRLKGLVDRGNAREVGEDKCRVSGKKILLYDVTRQKYKGEAPKTRGRKKPIIQGVEHCEECPLVVMVGDEEVCGLDTSLVCVVGGRPTLCKMNERDVLLRGT
jgi:hypothetical protein